MSEGPKKAKSKFSATRRLLLKSKLLKKAESLLVKEKEQKEVERENTLRERAPPLKLSGLSVQELQELCRDLHHKIDIVDEARYDLNIKVARNEAEILSLTQKIYELKGKMKRPNLRRVKKSADAMLGSLTDTRTMKADFKANLKTVKKEEEKHFLSIRRKRSQTGGKTWRRCQAWRAGRSFSMPDSRQQREKRLQMIKGHWYTKLMLFV
ncbi:troponin I, slow skeletal muscle-like isoform X2 [Carassius auratus]|uniref:Troponin I, slow skeletal muscle-like isoform X2 n=1 Tax=Carassius auratus TaxID=7957 RepID=A0A6P6LJW9_CARAU|nr:troponin I, slow skeletal muscle-like isoform X2 [Carassius auratus]